MKLDPDEQDAVVLWAEIHRLRTEAQGPNGMTWKEAALAERILRVQAQQSTPEKDRKDVNRYRRLRLCSWDSSPLCVVRDPKRIVTLPGALGTDCPSHFRLDEALDEMEEALK